MYEKQPPREIKEMINFPDNLEYKFDNVRFYNKIIEKTEKKRNKYQREQQNVIKYQIGEKVLLRNRELPSTMEGITKKLLLLYTCLLYTSRCV